MGHTWPAKDVLVRGVPRLWRGRRLRSGTHTTSWIHVRRRCGLWGVRGVWRGRAEGWVGSAQPWWCRPSLGLGNRRRWRGRRRRPARRTIRTVSDKLPGLLAFQPTTVTLDAQFLAKLLHDCRSDTGWTTISLATAHDDEQTSCSSMDPLTHILYILSSNEVTSSSSSSRPTRVIPGAASLRHNGPHPLSPNRVAFFPFPSFLSTPPPHPPAAIWSRDDGDVVSREIQSRFTPNGH